MSSYHVTTGRPGVAEPREECAPVLCPECGGLECLCRPRFFAGQLLTDEDLNRLDHYIVEKGKLRNRYLHGWGVVCGLEVVCHPCNVVTVDAGYALSPCGEDIVVCSPVQVDVCDLINRCRDELRRKWECEPARYATETADCRDVYEEWVLAIRYDEKPSRGVMALRGGSSPSHCGCGGSGSCGGGSKSRSCGCGGGSKSSSSSSSCGCGGGASAAQGAKRATAASRKGAQAQCEPTVVCEGYTFEVYKLPRRKSDERRDLGAMFERVRECFQKLAGGAIPRFPTSPDKAAVHEWCCNLKEALLDLVAEHPVYECILAEKLARLSCPAPQDHQTPQQYSDLVINEVLPYYVEVGAEYIRYCVCSALLPPCPGPVTDPRVPLATVTVRRDNCRIVRVCNIGVRKFVTTFPNLQYWLSFIPFMRDLRRLLERACCEPFRLRPEPPRDPQTPTPGTPFAGAEREEAGAAEPRAAAAESGGGGGGAGGEGGGGGAAGGGGGGGDDEEAARVVNANVSGPAPPRSELMQMLQRAWLNREQTIDARTLFLGALGMTDARGRPLVTEAEMNNPLLFLGLNQIARPVVARIPEETPAVIANLIRLGRGGARDDDAVACQEAVAEVETIKAQLAKLEETVRRQQETIAELTQRPD